VSKLSTLLYLPLDSGRLHFENLAYLELRYTPYLRTPEHLSLTERIDQMAEIVEVVGLASQVPEYPIVTSQILCMHSRLPYEVNKAIVDRCPKWRLCLRCGCGGGDSYYAERLDEFVELYAYAILGLTPPVIYETFWVLPGIVAYLMRIGHGIQIPLLHPELLSELARRNQCWRSAPPYLKTGTLSDMLPEARL